MARDYRTLKLEILAETKQFVDDMKKGETQVESFGDKATKMGKVAAAAFAAAAAAAVAYAGKLAIDGVKAALEDEAAQTRLANALKNVTDATDDQIAAVEEQITQLSLANGVADDKLRPAFQRLATATGSLTEANKGLSLALDIAAATGKDVETVSNALGKAYEGNTGSLSRLGIGMSTAEMKALGLQGTMEALAQTFEGAATKQANTLEGQMKRLQVTFDEAKESVGTALLPTIQRLMDYFVNTFIPLMAEAKQKAIDPITKAFEDNKESMQTLFRFAKDYLVPLFEFTLVNAIAGIGKAIGSIISITGKVIQGVEDLINKAIDGINKILTVVNRLPGVEIPLLSNVNFVADKQPKVEMPFGGQSIVPQVSTSIGGSAGATGAGGGLTTAAGSAATVSKVAATVSQIGQDIKIQGTPDITERALAAVPYTPFSIQGNPSVGAGGFGDITIVVQAPSAIDEEGFQRSVVNALNEATNRGTGGLPTLRTRAAAL